MIALFFASAEAQDTVSAGATPTLDAQSFHPSLDSHEFLRVVDTDLGERGFGARAIASYTLAPLQYTYWDGTTVDLVGSLVQLDAIGTYTAGPFRVGVDVPVLLRSFGGSEADTTGLGDLALDAKLRLLDHDEAAVGLALGGRTSLPTATVGGALGAGGPGGTLTASLDRPLGERVDAAIALGFTFQPDVAMENVAWGDHASLQAGLAWRTSDRMGLAAEFYTAGGLADLANAKARPTELLLGGWHRSGARSALVLRPAVGFGLNDAVTSPELRAVLGLAWDPLAPKGPPDTDKDGVTDDIDACPSVPEDIDQYEDGDGCAELAKLTVIVIDTDGVVVPNAEWTAAGRTGKSGEGVELPAGPVDVTAAGLSATAQVPAGGAASVEIRVPAPRGTLAVNMVDKDGKPVAGATWTAKGPTPVEDRPAGSVQVRPGSYKLIGKAPDYRPGRADVELLRDGTATLTLELLPAKATLQREKIEIKDSVYFETGKAVIKAESFALLDEVADILKDHPELTKVRIEGNTDSRGAAADNLKLSQARAESVREYLIGKGVGGERLEAIGYGEGKPLVKEKTAADQAKNRRVDFVVAGRSDGDVQGPTRVVPTQGDAPKGK